MIVSATEHPVLRKVVFVSYYYTIEDLVRFLIPYEPRNAELLRKCARETRNGLLSVGLKLHIAESVVRTFSPLVKALGGIESVVYPNGFRKSESSFCLVLPPVGSAAAANLLLESLSNALNLSLFGNQEVQLQICSPGRLSERRAALLGLAFYLGSDTLRRHSTETLETTFSRDPRYGHSYGIRFILYDAYGTYDSDFEWWYKSFFRRGRKVSSELPIERRTDVLIGAGSAIDVHNVNLAATLLIHAQCDEYNGYWNTLGKQFEKDIHLLMNRHHLAGVMTAPWVYAKSNRSHDDLAFELAFGELTAYVFDEAQRIRKHRKIFSRGSSLGKDNILQEMHDLLVRYREEIELRSSGGIR
jgi:hypothetical protein